MTIAGMPISTRLTSYRSAAGAAPAVAAPAPQPAAAPVRTTAAPVFFDWNAAQSRLGRLTNELSAIRAQIQAMMASLQAPPAPAPTPAPAPKAPEPPKAPAPTKPEAKKPEPKKPAKPEASKKPEPDGRGPLLKEGHAGAPVKALQKRLKKLGYNVGAVDGLFGNQTEAAVKKFQKKHGLTADGVVGKQTWKDLDITVKGKPKRMADSVVMTSKGPMVRRQGYLIHKSIAPGFDRMVAAAKKAGVNLQINSAFRSYQEQVVLWNRYGRNPARVARPGTSNHESGKAIDFANSPGAYAWLKANAHRYGLRNYPPEPWHYSPTGSGAPGSTPGAPTLEVLSIGL